MTITISGTTGLAGVDGSAGTPAVQGADTNTGVFFPAADTVAIATSGTEAMRVDSSQNVGIGTTSPGAKLQVTGNSSNAVAVFDKGGANQAYTQLKNSSQSYSTYVDINNNGTNWLAQYDTTNSQLIDVYVPTSYRAFYTANTERARIDSSGNLLVGTTSPASNVGGFQVSYNPGAGKFAGAVVNTKTDNSTVTQGFLVKYTGVSPSDGNYIFLCQDSGNTNRFFVTNAGGTGGTSDAALKKNIETTRDGYVNDLCKIRIVKYNWKTQDDNAPKYLGWIAQEVEEVFPRMVETDPETGFKSVTYSPFVPMLIKAVQEQQALIESLTARIAALEAK